MAAGVLVRGEFRPGGVEREWCDPEVLRMLRRRSLAQAAAGGRAGRAARRSARFLPAWQGVGIDRSAGADRLAEVIAQLEGLALPASVLERDILPARVARLRRRGCSTSCWRRGRWSGSAPGRSAGTTAGSSCGAPTGWGSLRGCRRSQRAPTPPADDEAGWPRRSWATCADRGASFYRELLAAVLRAAASGRRAPADPAGAAGRAVGPGLVGQAHQRHVPAASARCAGRGRVATGQRRDRGWAPPVGSGRRREPGAGRSWRRRSRPRWRIAGGTPPSDTERRHALALRLLDRNGLLTRDGAAAEDVPGGFAAVYPILREMEDRGRIRRGYFVEGLGGAQFALPGAVDRLRAGRSAPGDSDRGTFGSRDVVLLAATDPANPYGVTLPWPRRATTGPGPRSRAPRAPTSCSSMATPWSTWSVAARPSGRLPAFADAETAALALRALAGLVADGRMRSLQIARIDGLPVASSPHRDDARGGRLRGGLSRVRARRESGPLRRGWRTKWRVYSVAKWLPREVGR